MKQLAIIVAGRLAAVAVLLVLATSGVAASGDDQALIEIIDAVESGWENADGTPFRRHYLDFEGARYVESGGQNTGLNDLIEHHVEPEGDALTGLDLVFSDIETHIEGGRSECRGDSYC